MNDPARSTHTVRADCLHCAATGQCVCISCGKHGEYRQCVQCKGQGYYPVPASEMQERPCHHCKGEGKCGCHTCLIVLLGSPDSPDLDELEQLSENGRQSACSICRGRAVQYVLASVIREDK